MKREDKESGKESVKESGKEGVKKSGKEGRRMAEAVRYRVSDEQSTVIRPGKQFRTAAVILAAGSGKRMGAAVKKQYLLLEEKPVLYYALKAFEESPVDEMILVTSSGDEEYCQSEIIERYGFKKVSQIIHGGRERYHSVYEALKALERRQAPDYVLIQDGARPFADTPMILRAMRDAVKYKACAVGMPAKDTIKLSDELGFAGTTLERKKAWMIQTPQAFSYELIRSAYDKLMSREEYQRGITDDAMVVENMTEYRVKLTEGSYENIKVTTPEDMAVAAAILGRRDKIEKK